MLRNEGETLRSVVVCTPGASYLGVDDLEAHHLEELADPERTLAQHRALVALLRESGAWVWDVPELAGHPNSTFTRDMAVVTPEGAIQLRMGLETRRLEEDRMMEALEAFGEPSAGCIEEPGTAEGGDVVLMGDVAFLGRSGRTNEEGVRQLEALLEPMGYEVRVAAVPEGCLHLGAAMSAVGPRRVVAAEGVFEDGYFDGVEVVWIPSSGDSPTEANVICLGPDEVVADASGPAATVDALQAAGVKVHSLDLSEFRKGAGGPLVLDSAGGAGLEGAVPVGLNPPSRPAPPAPPTRRTLRRPETARRPRATARTP